MNVLLFVDDYYSEKGVCYDVHFSKKILEQYTDLDVYILHWAEKSEKKVFTIYGLNIFQQIMKVKETLNTNKIDIVHIRGIGLMSRYHFVYYWGSILSKSKLIMSTFSQVTDYSLNHKLFFEDPHVKKLVSNTVRILKIKNKILAVLSPILKNIYLRIFGLYFIRKSNAIVFFSEFEKNEVSKYCTLPDVTEIIEEPILNILNIEKKIVGNKNKANLYKKMGFGNYINIVYWGRLDYEVKGIDRIIRGLIATTSIGRIKIHLMGPNYNNRKEKIEKIVKKMNLSNMVIIHQSDIWKGTMKPLMDADFSILASRADGFPRALRESIALKVPVICSIETNFGEVLKRFECGLIFDNEKELVDIFNHLELEKISRLKENCLNAKIFLSEKNNALKLDALYKRVIK